MTELHVLSDWADIAVQVAFWVCATWPAVVRVFWPWHKHEWGWNMVIKTELIAVALLASTLKLEFGIQPGSAALLWVVVLAVTAIPLVVIWRTWIIWRAQRDGAARDLERPAQPEDAGRP